MKLLINAPFEFAPAELDQVRRLVPSIDVVTTWVMLAESIDGTDVAIYVGEHVPRTVAGWKNLRWVQLMSAGTNQFEGHPMWDLRIPITTASGLHGVPMAQF